jgi:hypothetical protein
MTDTPEAAKIESSDPSRSDALALVAWLRTCLDQDEATARACPPWPWRIEYDDNPDITASPGRRRGVLLDANEDAPSLVVSDPYGEVGPAHEHIARHDPARVLKEVQAKRRLLDLYYLWRGTEDSLDGMTRVGPSIPVEEEESFGLLKALALPYSDRPGYLNTWAVS